MVVLGGAANYCFELLLLNWWTWSELAEDELFVKEEEEWPDLMAN